MIYYLYFPLALEFGRQPFVLLPDFSAPRAPAEKWEMIKDNETMETKLLFFLALNISLKQHLSKSLAHKTITNLALVQVCLSKKIG